MRNDSIWRQNQRKQLKTKGYTNNDHMARNKQANNFKIEDNKVLAIKGFDAERPPIIRLSDKRIRNAKKVKYLVVTIKEKMNMMPHLNTGKEKSLKRFAKVRIVAKEGCKVNGRQVTILHDRIFAPIMT